MATINKPRKATQGRKNKVIKMVNTRGLKRLNYLSINRGYNRNLSRQFFLDADPKGTHVLYVLMIHEHPQMQPVAPHYRCMVLAKMQGQGEFTPVILDLPMQSFQSLQDAVA